jgi:hypothetical protein
LRICVRPDHLFDGTRRQNLEDASAKGRLIGKTKGICAGARNGRAKLTESSVRRIRTLWRTGGYTLKDLAGAFRVSTRSIWKAATKTSFQNA